LVFLHAAEVHDDQANEFIKPEVHHNGAEGVSVHLENVGELLGKALEISDLTRLEVHGPADEIEKLKGPMGELNPQWFIHHSGV
ncbi:MAG: hypothetical protein AAF585_19555, partial [Verrucomicrobiota bacterium]